MPRVATRSPSKGPTKARFERVFADGKRENGSFARVSALSGTGLIGYAVSRKVGGKPQRNRQRRRFKAAVWECREALSSSLDYVFILGPSCAEAPFGRITEEARDLIRRVNARWAEASESL